ncbi:hypothetical protein [Yimella sp. cx-51]|uniref:hypothetical protein n=1 Tax=Yimella sp. cx-51 TaxID=2770551 RepID=UPI00165D6ECA|nr:hypothetical protein [Yimella sp. cx-51]MBC9958270.1 hypothetical protein [Yimella sp. cx-51]MBD2758858.1 hypothetical protein [Yimella sp. cx-573]QTH39729.1 hypothetical protein J5M86_03405 [Yimella sp. cx-51]
MLSAPTPAGNITAGLGGFLVLFFLAVSCWFLFRSMNTRLRRMRYESGDLTSKHKQENADGRGDAGEV